MVKEVLKMQEYCQSCGMPLENSLRGTEGDGTVSHDYCIYCYKNGEFTQPHVTMEEMINICIPHMLKSGFDEEEAQRMLSEFLPTLKRWKK